MGRCGRCPGEGGKMASSAGCRCRRSPWLSSARAIARSGDSEHVFPSKVADVPITAHAATRAICRARPTLRLDHFRVHDLRRTVATGMASLGVNPHTISLVLDHISVTKGTVTGAVYVKYSFDREKREALERWASHLQRLIG
ncbi:MAG TPA: tyrosine-type recombinase/integrase [Sinorhizobium sp.]|nr:tyrosine-type recombinase/integrase [Sinorhizobium sp.]